MPLSIWLGMEDCLAEIVEARPESVLDVGIGFGLWGHLMRQYLDVWSGRIRRPQWRTRIDGIEIAADRVQPHARCLYDRVYIGDMRRLVPECAARTRYDLILFGDVLEHIPKDEALYLLKTALALAGARVVVRIPLGDGWRREGRESPDHHRSRWELDDFEGLPGTRRVYHFWGNPYALLALDAPAWRQSVLARSDGRLAGVEAQVRELSGLRAAGHHLPGRAGEDAAC